METHRKTTMPRAQEVYDTTGLNSPHECSECRKELKALLTAENYMALEAQCIREFGLPAGVLARQLVYWEGKGHDPEGWIYKTKADLFAELGLSTGTVDTARRRLEGRGVLETELRPKRRADGRTKHPSPVIHYRLDLHKLAQVLGILNDDATLNHESKPQESMTLNPANPHPSTVRNGTFHTHRGSPKTSQESSRFQRVDDDASDSPMSPKDRSSPSIKEERFDNDAPARCATPPREAATHVEALTGDVPTAPFKVASPPKLEPETKNRAWWILEGGEGENDVTRSVDRYLSGGADANGEPLTVARVAKEVQEHIGGDEPLEAFVPWVERCLEDVRAQRAVAESVG